MGERKTEAVCMFGMQVALIRSEESHALVAVVPSPSWAGEEKKAMNLVIFHKPRIY